MTVNTFFESIDFIAYLDSDKTLNILEKPVTINSSIKKVAKHHKWNSLGIVGNTVFLLDTHNKLWECNIHLTKNYYPKPTSIDISLTEGSEGNTWKMLHGGGHHVCLIKEDNTLWGCGWNIFGQLGLGTKPNENSGLVQIGLDNDWKLVECGDYHTLAIKQDGSLWSWGDNEHGQLGNGGFGGDSLVPICVSEDKDWISIGAKNSYSVAVKEDQSVWFWGTLSDNVDLNPEDVIIKDKIQILHNHKPIQNIICTRGSIILLHEQNKAYIWEIDVTIDPVLITMDEPFKFIYKHVHATVAVDHNGYIWGWGSFKVQDKHVSVSGLIQEDMFSSNAPFEYVYTTSNKIFGITKNNKIVPILTIY